MIPRKRPRLCSSLRRPRILWPGSPAVWNVASRRARRGPGSRRRHGRSSRRAREPRSTARRRSHIVEGQDGRMASTGEIVAGLLGSLGGPMSGLRLLVTAGGTREPIDSVRFIGNRSSGKMGLAVAREALRLGAGVTVVAANVEGSSRGPDTMRSRPSRSCGRRYSIWPLTRTRSSWPQRSRTSGRPRR